MVTCIRFGLLCIVLFLCALTNVQADFTNGDFSAGLDAWTDLSNGGTFSVNEGRAVLQTESGTSNPFSVSFVQGDNGALTFDNPVTIPNTAIYLSVDISLTQLAVADDSEIPGANPFVDNLAISFYDVNSLGTDPTLSFVSGNDFNPTDALTTFLFDVSSIIGSSGAFYFDLNDEIDGYDSRAMIDNIHFSQIPVPAALWLFVSALVLLIKKSLRLNIRSVDMDKIDNKFLSRC